MNTMDMDREKPGQQFKTYYEEPYAALTPLLCFQLMAIHTWPASILPTLIGISCAFATGVQISGLICIITLLICVLMQSAANTLNDYFDYIKGTDTLEDNLDPTDSVLVYNHVNPKHVLMFGLGQVVVGFLLGIYIIVLRGPAPLIIALIGALCVLAYSGGKTPISYLPIGEFVSGIVMGGLIPLGVYVSLTGDLNFMVLLWSIPSIIGVGLIMMTNNTCDLEKDIEARRVTLPGRLGRAKARAAYRIMAIIEMVSGCVIVLVCFTNGMLIIPFGVLASYPLLRALLKNPLTQEARISAMGQICSYNVAWLAFYAFAIMFCMRGVLVL